jgi:hypothetical protein
MATSGPVAKSQNEVENVVTVIIKVNARGELEEDPGNFKLSKSKHQQVLWQASDRKSHFNVDFGENSPFEYSQFSDVEPYSGLVRREVLGDPNKYYKYTVSAGGKSKDPGGIVNP